MSEPRLTVVVVSFNTRQRTLDCVRSVVAGVAAPVEIVVADNASSDGSAEALQQDFPTVRVLPMGGNLGFAAANNRALDATSAPLVLLINSDAELRPGAFEALAAVLDAHPDVAAVGPRTLNADGSVQPSWGRDLTLWNEWRQRRLQRRLARDDARTHARLEALARQPREPDWLSGSCLLARRDALAAVGRFDEGYFLYEEDADLCLRLRRAGWRLRFCPEAEVVHHGGASVPTARGRAQLEYHRSHLRYYALHRNRLQRGALRAWLLLRGLTGWLAAARQPDRRAHWTAVLKTTLGVAGDRRHVLR
jgi:GT2 family glycosyltransferase